MDPDACLERLLGAMEGEPDYEEVIPAARDLAGWLDGGGFPPDLGKLDPEERHIVSVFFCQAVIDLGEFMGSLLEEVRKAL